jgi:hypothetical protein
MTLSQLHGLGLCRMEWEIDRECSQKDVEIIVPGIFQGQDFWGFRLERELLPKRCALLCVLEYQTMDEVQKTRQSWLLYAIVRTLKKLPYFKVLSKNLLGGTVENYEKPQSM